MMYAWAVTHGRIDPYSYGYSHPSLAWMQIAASYLHQGYDNALMNPPSTRKEKTMLATRPDIDTIAITRTFDGINVIDLKTLQVNYKTCQENAISVKGYSGVRELS